MLEAENRRAELEEILLEFVTRTAKKENATPEELKALPEVAGVLVASLNY